MEFGLQNTSQLACCCCNECSLHNSDEAVHVSVQGQKGDCAFGGDFLAIDQSAMY